MASKVEVYDPPMCCSTGVCGPDPDAALAQFSADLDALREAGIEVERHNMAQKPNAFTENPEVLEAISKDMNALPIIVVDGAIWSQGTYPNREALLALANGHEQTAGPAGTDQSSRSRALVTREVSELIALGASIAANCETCFEQHYEQAQQLGISEEDMIRAVNMALAVKDASHRTVLRKAEERLVGETSDDGGGCCGGGSC